MFAGLLQNITRGIGAATLFAKVNAPTIMIVAGTGATVTAGVIAAKKAVDHREVMADSNVRVDGVHGLDLRDAQDRAEVLGAHIERARVFLKHYRVPLALGTAGVALILGGNGVMQARYGALAFAYRGLEESFDAYKQHVTEVFGPDAQDKLLKNPVKRVAEGEDGEELEVELTPTPGMFSQYAVCFDQTNVNWEPSAEMNKYYLHCNQQFFQNRLLARGHVFLNEVYDRLGFPRTKAGAIVGWSMEGPGDHYIDFGLYTEKSADFINGNEAAVWLDPNVDGVILDRLGSAW